MANLSKIKRDKMIAFLEELKKTHAEDDSIRAFDEIENHLREKKYGLIWEEHSEEVDELLEENIPILTADPERRLCKDETLPWNFIIEGDNLQALYLLGKTHRGKVDCIYIDPPYNTGARDWKYNNDYVDGNDVYRHSKWLSMMKNRLTIAKQLLNPDDSVLIVTIDEKEYLHLGCLLEEMFPTSIIQMITTVINPKGSFKDEEGSLDYVLAFTTKEGKVTGYTMNIAMDMGVSGKMLMDMTYSPDGKCTAKVVMEVQRRVDNLPTDTTASILTAGLLGEKYISLSIGGEEDVLVDGDVIYDTQSSLVLEELIGKFLMNTVNQD